jgi:undecaprenyl-diphosphatase
MLDLFAFDQSILSALTSPALSAIKPLFFALTEFGSPTALLVYSAIVIALGNTKLKKVAVVLAISFLLASLVTGDIKDLVQRQRPYGGIAPAYLYTNDYSFPSGHAVTAFIGATIILAYFGWKWGLVSYFVAALIGMSRIVLDVHYPSDVLAGAVIGIVLGELVLFAAYRVGLLDRPSMISTLIHAKNKEKNTPTVTKKPMLGQGSYLILIAILLGLILPLLSLSYMSYGIAVMALASILIICAMPFITNERAPMTSIISLVLVGTISAYATLITGGYIISLAIAAFTYIAILMLSGRNGNIFASRSQKV